MTSSVSRDRSKDLHLALMLALTFTTGVVDAVGYLGLDRVFTGNMTGNVVILAMGLTGADNLPIIGPTVALVLFVVGAATAGRSLRGLSAGWHRRTTMLLVVVVILLGATTISAFLSGHRPEWVDYSITGALGLAIGMQAGAARHIAIAVVTSTLVGLAFDSRLGRGTDGHPWARRVGAIALIGAGAPAAHSSCDSASDGPSSSQRCWSRSPSARVPRPATQSDWETRHANTRFRAPTRHRLRRRIPA